MLEFVTALGEAVEGEKLYRIHTARSMDWDGQRLLIGGFMTDEWYRNENCDFYLAVYGKEGLEYYGEYQNSLTQPTFRSGHRLSCNPVDYMPMEVRWEIK